MINFTLLDDVMDRIEKLAAAGLVGPPLRPGQDLWEQGWWRTVYVENQFGPPRRLQIFQEADGPVCGSSMCLAGWTAEMAGGTWAPDWQGRAWLVREAGDVISDAYNDRSGLVHVFDRARSLLGLTTTQAEQLFDGDNTLAGLRRIVAELRETA